MHPVLEELRAAFASISPAAARAMGAMGASAGDRASVRHGGMAARLEAALRAAATYLRRGASRLSAQANAGSHDAKSELLAHVSRIFFRDGGFATTRKKMRASGGACPAGGWWVR